MAVDAMILNERPDIGWHWHDRLSGEQTECTNEQTGRLRQETMGETQSHGGGSIPPDVQGVSNVILNL